MVLLIKLNNTFENPPDNSNDNKVLLLIIRIINTFISNIILNSKDSVFVVGNLPYNISTKIQKTELFGLHTCEKNADIINN